MGNISPNEINFFSLMREKFHLNITNQDWYHVKIELSLLKLSFILVKNSSIDSPRNYVMADHPLCEKIIFCTGNDEGFLRFVMNLESSPMVYSFCLDLYGLMRATIRQKLTT